MNVHLNDIALIKTKKNVKFGLVVIITKLAYNHEKLLYYDTKINYRSFVQPICLPTTNYNFEKNKKVKVSGWGANKFSPGL